MGLLTVGADLMLTVCQSTRWNLRGRIERPHKEIPCLSGECSSVLRIGEQAFRECGAEYLELAASRFPRDAKVKRVRGSSLGDADNSLHLGRIPRVSQTLEDVKITHLQVALVGNTHEHGAHYNR